MPERLSPKGEESGAALARWTIVLALAGVVAGLALNGVRLAAGWPGALAWRRTEKALAVLGVPAPPPAVVAAPAESSAAAHPASSATTRSPAPTAPAAPSAAPPTEPAPRSTPSPTPAAGATPGATAPPAPPATAADLPAVPDSRDPIEIPLATAKRFHDAGAALFVDARERDEYVAGHIAGAVSLPFDEAWKDAARLAAVDPGGRPIIVYCDGGDCEASKNLAYSLIDAGQHKVLVLAAGLPDWQQAGYPVATGEGR